MNANVRPPLHWPPARLTRRTDTRYQAASSRISTSIGTSTRHSVNARASVSLGGPL